MKRAGQREFMRELRKRFGADKDRVTTEYAKAERNGEVERENNTSGYTPEQYAHRLWEDGICKGWLRN